MKNDKFKIELLERMLKCFVNDIRYYKSRIRQLKKDEKTIKERIKALKK